MDQPENNIGMFMQAIKEMFPGCFMEVNITENVTPVWTPGGMQPSFVTVGRTAVFTLKGDATQLFKLEEKFGRWLKLTARRGSVSARGISEMQADYLVTTGALEDFRAFYEMRFTEVLEEELSKKQE